MCHLLTIQASLVPCLILIKSVHLHPAGAARTAEAAQGTGATVEAQLLPRDRQEVEGKWGNDLHSVLTSSFAVFDEPGDPMAANVFYLQTEKKSHRAQSL